MKKAVVVLSGGQDSATCLLKAIAEFDEVIAISFDYGQRHRVELDCAREQCKRLDVPHVVVDFGFLRELGSNALTDGTVEVKEDGGMNGLPSTFVPGRNVLFLTSAAAFAVNQGIFDIITGVCETDFSGYPDCRHSTISSLEATLALGLGVEVRIHTPLMRLTKAQTWELAAAHDGVDFIRNHTHTCYNGNHTDLHEWGYGCGDCPACVIRARGFHEWNG